MFQATTYSGKKVDDYTLVLNQLQALSEDEKEEIAILSNASALLNQCLSEVNSVGFYIWKEDQLVLGPFQGLPVCILIPYGNGVCLTVVKESKTQRVAVVMKFLGYIACDSASQSEIFIPIIINDNIYGVLDIDSPVTNRFDEVDQTYLEKFVNVLEDLLS